MGNNTAYDHFSNPSNPKNKNGLFAHVKQTKLFNGNLQITEKETEAKGIPSVVQSMVHNTINSMTSPVVDYMNRVSSRAMNIIKPVATATIGSPITTVKENGFWKGGAKMVGSTVVGATGLATDTVSAAIQAPAKVYERLINANVQDGADVLHLFSKKMRDMDKLGFKTVLPGFIDGLGNGMKILSKMGGYASGIYALNWMGKYINKGMDAAQEYVKLNNVELEGAKHVITPETTADNLPSTNIVA